MSSRIPLISVVASVLVVVSLVYAHYFSPRSGYDPVAPPAVSEVIRPIEETRPIVMSGSMLSVPGAASASEIPPSELSEDLSFLLRDRGTRDVRVELVNYRDGRGGYRISYTADSPLQELYFETLRILEAVPTWEFLSGGRTESFANLEWSSLSYDSRLQFARISDRETEVQIDVIERQ